MRAAVILAALAVASVTKAVSQEQPTPEPGQRVRVTAPGYGLHKSVGTWVALSAGRMELALESGGETLSLDVDSVAALEVVGGRKSNTAVGSGIGFLTGAVGGAIVAAVVYGSSGNPGEEFFTESQATLVGAGVFGVCGALIGALVGSQIESDRWVEVPLDRLRVSIVPQHHGRVVLGLSVSF